MKLDSWFLGLIGILVCRCSFPVSEPRPPDSYFLQFDNGYNAYSRDWKKRVAFIDEKLNDSISFLDSTTGKVVSLNYVKGELQEKKEEPNDCPPGQRSTKDILRVIREETPTGIRKVYNRFLYRSPRLGGKVTVKFHIMKNGTVFSVLPIGDTTGDPQFVNAISNEVINWKFVKSSCNSYDIVTVPFTFAP